MWTLARVVQWAIPVRETWKASVRLSGCSWRRSNKSLDLLRCTGIRKPTGCIQDVWHNQLTQAARKQTKLQIPWSSNDDEAQNFWDLSIKWLVYSLCRPLDSSLHIALTSCPGSELLSRMLLCELKHSRRMNVLRWILQHLWRPPFDFLAAITWAHSTSVTGT